MPDHGTYGVRVVWGPGEMLEATDDRREQERAVARKRAFLVVGALGVATPTVLAAAAAAVWSASAWWVSAVLTGAAVAAAVVARRARVHLEDALNRADDSIGVPVPRDLVSTVLDTRLALRLLDETVQGYAGEDALGPAFARLLAVSYRDLGKLDVICTDQLHATRRDWVRGELDRWHLQVEYFGSTRIGIEPSGTTCVLGTAAPRHRRSPLTRAGPTPPAVTLPGIAGPSGERVRRPRRRRVVGVLDVAAGPAGRGERAGRAAACRGSQAGSRTSAGRPTKAA